MQNGQAPKVITLQHEKHATLLSPQHRNAQINAHPPKDTIFSLFSLSASSSQVSSTLSGLEEQVRSFHIVGDVDLYSGASTKALVCELNVDYQHCLLLNTHTFFLALYIVFIILLCASFNHGLLCVFEHLTKEDINEDVDLAVDRFGAVCKRIYHPNKGRETTLVSCPCLWILEEPWLSKNSGRPMTSSYLILERWGSTRSG
ncbi:hypothetical protein RRG08_024064 [Elysia crispata]|uniref:Uncharacterized protein n=1 Tax=Elysia crispata TaxID=231223 RepID=A0AAE0ZNZ9_9GAST|nr:hypothetical protein RRG08_024064 [Elysia crispata]